MAPQLLLSSSMVTRVQRLDFHGQASFAACSCERVMEFYIAMNLECGYGSPAKAQRIMDEVWQCIAEPKSLLQFQARWQEELETIFPSDDLESSYQSCAGLFCASLGEICSGISDQDSKHFLEAASFAVQALDTYLCWVNLPLGSGGDASWVERVANFTATTPLWKEEQQNQELDVELLENRAMITGKDITQMRTRAQASGVRPIARGLVGTCNRLHTKGA